MKLQILGGGKMGQAILWGLFNSPDYDSVDLAIVDISKDRRKYLTSEFPEIEVLDAPLANVECLIAVKPNVVLDLCEVLVNPTRVISVAAGIPTASIEAKLPEKVPVIRAMPNTPALVNSGITAIAKGSNASEKDLTWARQVLASVGGVVDISEDLLDVVTGLSGSGPAYIFKIAEAMADAGVAGGLEMADAKRLAYKTIIGSAKLLDEPEADATKLKEAVATPKGTTEAGLDVLEAHNLNEVFKDAIFAAAKRSKELGQG